MLLLVLCLLSLCSCISTIFQQNFQSSNFHPNKWTIIGSGNLIQIFSGHGNNKMLSMNYGTDPRQIASRWITASPGSYYSVEFNMQFNIKALTFSPSISTYMIESNLPKDHFQLTFTYPSLSAGAVVLSLVNPHKNQALTVTINAGSIVMRSEISNTSCSLSVWDNDDITVSYSAGERSLAVEVDSHSLKCLYSTTSFVYDVAYYTIKTNTTQTLNIKKSGYGYCGLTVSLQATDTGCSINSSGSNCLLIYGHPYLSTAQPSSLPPSTSNTSFKASYIFLNTFSAFRLLLSDLKQFEQSPQPYDTFIDNIVISILNNPGEYRTSVESYVMRFLQSGVSEVSYANLAGITTSGVQVGVRSGRFFEKKRDSGTRLLAVQAIKTTDAGDIVETDGNVTGVWTYAGDDVIVTAGATQTIYSGTGNDIIVASCQSSTINLPDHSNFDVIDLNAFGINSLTTSSTFSVTTSGTNTVLRLTPLGKTITITLPSSTTINLSSSPTAATCSLDIGVGYYPALNKCLYVCPCLTSGLFCAYSQSFLSSTPRAQTSNIFCGPYQFSSTPRTTLLDGTYRLAPVTIPHYKLTIIVKLAVSGYTLGDSLTVYADYANIVLYTVMNTAGRKYCLPGAASQAMYLNETINHNQDSVNLRFVLQSTAMSSVGIRDVGFILWNCFGGCQYCNGSQPTDCINCSPPMVFSAAGQCYCPGTAVLVNPTVCISCDSLYTDCQICNTSNCRICKNGLIINSDLTCINATTCVKDCLQCDPTQPYSFCILCQTSFYLASPSSCEPCSINCLQCTSSLCLQCSSGYHIRSSNASQCTFICDPTCLECSGPLPNQCTSCLAPRTLATNIPTCNCPLSMYMEEDWSCQKCKLPCFSCVSQNRCLTCLNQFNYSSVTMECTCQLGKYPSVDSTRCLDCSQGCVSCVAEMNCTECFYGWTLNNTTGICQMDNNSAMQYQPNTLDLTTKDLSQSSYIVGGLSSLPIVLRGNPLVLLQLFDITQQISYIQYINVSVPDNFDSYLQLFIKFNLNFFPSIVTDDTIVMKSPPGFADSQMDALFFRNISSNLILLAITLAFYLLLKLLQKLIHKTWSNSLPQFIMDKLVGMFEWAGWITMLMGSYVGLAVSCFLQLRNSSVRNAMMFASYVCAFVLLVMLLALPVLLLKITEKGFLMGREVDRSRSQGKRERAKESKEEYDRKFGMIYQMYRTDTVYQRNFSIAILIRKILYSFNIVYLQEVLTAQMVVFCLTQLSLLMALIFIKPYQNPVFFAKDILTQTLCPLLYVTFMLYGLNSLDFKKQTSWGYVDVFTVTIIIIMHLIVLLIESYNSIKQLWLDYKKFKDPNRGAHEETQAPIREPREQEEMRDAVIAHNQSNMDLVNHSSE